MHPIESAIASLESELVEHGLGMNVQDNSPEWFLLRAKTLGLSYLRRAKQLEIQDDLAAADRYYRKCSETFKAVVVPPAVVVQRELLPDGTLPTGAVGA